MIPELDDRVARAAAVLQANDSGTVVQRCISNLECSTDIPRDCRRKLRAAFERLMAAFQNVAGRVVNLVMLIKTAMKDTKDNEPRLQFQFCGMIEQAAV